MSTISEQKLTGPQSMLIRKRFLWMGVFSILASAGAVVADLILQYDPQGNYSLTTPAPLTIVLWRVYVGSLLGVFCIPLVITGYWVVCTVLRETAPRLFRILFWVMAYAIVIGTVFHSTFLAFILVEQAARATTGSAQASLFQLQNALLVFSVPLAAFFEICYLVMWSIVVVTVLRRATRYPRWIVLFVPALLSIIIAGVGQSHVVPVLGNVLYPTVFSLPHLVFFLLSTLILWRIDLQTVSLKLQQAKARSRRFHNVIR
jgi:hypothetical protein